MGHPDRHPCAWARRKLDGVIADLTEIEALDESRRDALPGSVMKLVKEAKRILVKRHKPRADKGPKVDD